MKILVTGSGGLIGSYAVEYFAHEGYDVFGLDNNMRQIFFGRDGSTKSTTIFLNSQFNKFKSFDLDIRDEKGIDVLFSKYKFDAIIHCAAQPSHDLASQIPLTDFDVNARSTLILLESFRKYSPTATFIYLSTNKVYGDTPNKLPITEQENRFEFSDNHFENGIDEKMSIDYSLHSLFGVSKLSADLMVQEYGRYFNLNTTCFRGGCLTGPRHSSVSLHGFLSYLIKCNLREKDYFVYGYKGKQVRDQIHARDVVQAIDLVINNPKKSSVYNLGGGFLNSASILELDSLIYNKTKKKTNFIFGQPPRIGDHVCYYSNLSKFKNDFPSFSLSYDLETIVDEMIGAEKNR
jgi:CDP-paratose 2-epimerase